MSHRAWKFSSVKLGELSCYFFLIRNSLWVSGYKYTNNLLSVHTEKAYFFGGNSPANFQHELTGVIFWSYLFLSWRCHAGELCFSYLIRAPPVLDFDFSKFRTRRSCAMADNYFIEKKYSCPKRFIKHISRWNVRSEHCQRKMLAMGSSVMRCSPPKLYRERICYAIHYSQALKRLRSLPSCAASCIYALISYLRKNESS